jgi:SAM-dependent methyltransferase
MSNDKYPDFVSRFYDVIYDQVRSGTDFNYYLNKILNTKGTVLEIGVGTGRFFIAAIKQGADIYGVDFSENMLEQLKNNLDLKHHDRVEQQDIRQLKLNKKFDLIIAPFRVFSHLIEIDDIIDSLNNICDHLNDDGKFIFDLYVPNLKLIAEGMKDQVEFDGFYEDGKKLKRITSFTTDVSRQVNEIEMKYIWDENDEEHSGTWHFPMRYFFRYELELLVRQSKLTLQHIYGDFEENELNPDSKEFLIVCGK